MPTTRTGCPLTSDIHARHNRYIARPSHANTILVGHIMRALEGAGKNAYDDLRDYCDNDARTIACRYM